MYYVVYFKVQGNIKEVFMADVMEATLVNHKVFMYQHAQDVELHQQDIGGPMGSYPPPIMT